MLLGKSFRYSLFKLKMIYILLAISTLRFI